jgi:hypothetical protein
VSARGSKLDRKQEALIAALLSEPSHEAAAKAAGVGIATLQRWLQVPEFQRAYRAARRAIVESAIGRLQGATGKAIETLVRNLDCPKPADQIRAASVLLEHAVKAVELGDLIERVEELARLLEGDSDAGQHPVPPAGPDAPDGPPEGGSEGAGGADEAGGEPQ